MKHATLFGLVLGLVTVTLPVFAKGLDSELVEVAPTLKKEVAKRAQAALNCSLGAGTEPDMLIVVDMSIEANKKRLWAFSLEDQEPQLVIEDYVAHGSGSDPSFTGRAKNFSNLPNSNMTSLGLYQIAERYEGKNGLSRRLDGLMKGWNDNARNRAVVMHPSNYVQKGKVGRSQGCPAVRPDVMKELEKQGLKNAMLWIDGPDKELNKAVASCGKGWGRPSFLQSLKKAKKKTDTKTEERKYPSNSVWAFTRSCYYCPFSQRWIS